VFPLNFLKFLSSHSITYCTKFRRKKSIIEREFVSHFSSLLLELRFVKDGEYEQVDNETLKRLRDIQKLKESNKQHVFAIIDAFIKQTKLQGIL
jgi:hypothetical protein